MGLFGRSKREMNNAASAAIPQARPIVPPGPTTIHNHSPSRFWDYVGMAVAAIIVLAACGAALWFLFSQLGARNPGESIAQLVIYGGLIAGGLWYLSFLFNPYFEKIQDFKLEIEREMTRREELKLLAAQTSIEPGRMNEEDFKFARVILAVMMSAFDYLETNQLAEFPRRWRPWSKTSTLETAEKIGVAVTHTQALEVAKWLATEGVITSPDGGQISKRFPNLSSVRAHLDNKFGKPIVVVSPQLRDNRGFKFTE